MTQFLKYIQAQAQEKEFSLHFLHFDERIFSTSGKDEQANDC